MLEMGGTENIIPNANTLEEWLQVYYQFYTQEQEKKFGVIGIYLRGI
jgi:ASC-1-like (ASCH) protein